MSRSLSAGSAVAATLVLSLILPLSRPTGATGATGATGISQTAPPATAGNPAATESPDGNPPQPPLTIAYSDGAKVRSDRPSSADEVKVLRRIAAATGATLTPLPAVRAPAAFQAGTADCLLGATWQLPPTPTAPYLVSAPLMTATFSFFRQVPAHTALSRPLRIAVNREALNAVTLPPALAQAELIGVNDIGQSIRLLLTQRVDYIIAYHGNVVVSPEYQSGQIGQDPTLPPALETKVVITCHDTPQAATFLGRLGQLTQQSAGSQQGSGQKHTP